MVPSIKGIGFSVKNVIAVKSANIFVPHLFVNKIVTKLIKFHVITHQQKYEYSCNILWLSCDKLSHTGNHAKLALQSQYISNYCDLDVYDDVNVDVNTDVYVLVQIKPGFWFLLCAGVFVGLRTQDLLAYKLVCTMVYALRVCLGTYLRYSSIRNIHKVCEKQRVHSKAAGPKEKMPHHPPPPSFPPIWDTS